MKLNINIHSVTLGVSLTVFSCGTKISVGNNANYDPTSVRDDDLEGEDPENEEIIAEEERQEFAGFNYTVSEIEGVDPQTKLTCFGPSPVIPSYLEEFCNSTDEALKVRFASSIKRICKEHTLINLFRPSCGWTGDGSYSRNFRIVERTDLADTSAQSFYFFAAFSVIVDSPAEQMLKLHFDRFEDPPKFREHFVDIENSTITRTTVDRTDGWMDFSATLASSSATAAFRGRIDIRKMTDDLTVSFDRSVGELTLINIHNYLMFYVPLDEQRTLVVGIDEKSINDTGNHSVAYNTVLTVAKQRMTNEYDNAKLD